jgi:hypothetical protein
MTPGMSAVQFQRQLGLTRYETAFQILHKLRAGMVRQGRDRIGGNLARGDHVEVDDVCSNRISMIPVILGLNREIEDERRKRSRK